ncbi:hypothetical protein MUG91_G51n108 [Manis pentadactyla]|nr:hypothetical protein MUG91_G51n108 [Manis pentadactyla]
MPRTAALTPRPSLLRAVRWGICRRGPGAQRGREGCSRLDKMHFFSSWIKAIFIIALEFPLYLEFENTPEDSPEPEARVVVPGRSETPGKLHAAAEDGIPQLPPDTVSSGPHEMTQPQVKRGVAVSWDRAEVLEPSSKKTRAEEFALPDGAPKTSSPFCAQECLPDIESSLESKALQGTDPADSEGEPPAREEDSRAEMPEGLVGLEGGFSSQVFRHVFSSLKSKKEDDDEAEVLEPSSKKTRAEEFTLPEGAPKTSSLKSKVPQGMEAYVEEEVYVEEPYVQEEPYAEEEPYVEEEEYMEEAHVEEVKPYVEKEEEEEEEELWEYSDDSDVEVYVEEEA